MIVPAIPKTERTACTVGSELEPVAKDVPETAISISPRFFKVNSFFIVNEV